MKATKILIIEDEILIARELEMTLHDLGYCVAGIAADGETALAKVAETLPDLVLMDIVLPGDTDGIETAEQIRRRFQIPVVFLTAYADAATLQRAKITEPFGYVLKPFQPQELNTAIQIALVRQQSEQLKLDTLRSNISASLPHEINTQLHNILGFTAVGLRYYDAMSKTELQETLECIQSAALKLERVCQNFLLYTKLELLAASPASAAQLRHAKTPSTADVIAYSAHKLARLHQRTSDLGLDLPDARVQMAEGYLCKIVEELLDNAFRFSDPETAVWISSDTREGYFYLTIRDSGQGMSPTQIAQIGAYMQFDRNRLEQQGLGLGLALVQRLVVLHGGQFWIESTPGQGTQVMLTLPTACS